jgi:hypothetical protein
MQPTDLRPVLHSNHSSSSGGVKIHSTPGGQFSGGVDILERGFTLGEVPGILWTPGSASAPAPLILLGHPGGLYKMYPRLVARARHSAAEGFAAATIELPGSGDRPRSTAAEEALLSLPEIRGPVGYAGGVIAIGVRLAVIEPRISAALLFAGSFVPRSLFEGRYSVIPWRACPSARSVDGGRVRVGISGGFSLTG